MSRPGRKPRSTTSCATEGIAMAAADVLVPARTSRLPRLGRLGWLLSSLLIAVLTAGAVFVAVAFGYGQKIVFGETTIIVPDRGAIVVIGAVATVFSILIGIMRRHDRNRNGLDIAAIYLLGLALGTLETFGYLS